MRGDIKSIFSNLALYSSKNECARTDPVFSPISQLCTRGVTLTEVSMCRSTQVQKYTRTQVCKFTSVEIYKFTSTQVYKYTSTQIPKNTSTKLHK